MEIEGQAPHSVFRFTETGISKYRDGLQKLCRENYKKLREYGVIPFDDNSQKQKVVYTRRLFQFVEPGRSFFCGLLIEELLLIFF